MDSRADSSILLEGKWQEISGLSAWESPPSTETLLSSHLVTDLFNYTVILIWRVRVAVLLIIMPRSLTCSLSSIFESSYDLCVAADFICYNFPFCRSSHLLALNFILFVSAHLYSYANNFVASVCPLHLLFRQGSIISKAWYCLFHYFVIYIIYMY